MRFLRYASKTDRRKLSSSNLHVKMLPKLHFKCNLNVIILFNYTDVIVCRLNAATRNHWAMNIHLFLFGIIFNTFVLNLGQFSFSYKFLYQSDTVQIILHRFRGYCMKELVLTVENGWVVQTKNLSIVCQYNGTCAPPCSVCGLNACLLNSLSFVLARCPPLTRVCFNLSLA